MLFEVSTEDGTGCSCDPGSFFLSFMKAEAPLQVGSISIARQKTEVWHQAATARAKPTEFQLTEAIHGLLRVLYSGRYKSCAPHALVQAVWTHANAQFANRRQNDAQEFLTFLLERLADELDAAGRRLIEDLFRVELQQVPILGRLSGLLGVTLVSCSAQTVVCSKCRARSARRESSHGLLLALPGDTATVGITDFAQGQLGDIVFVELPDVGSVIDKGKDAAVVESVKAASDVYAPITGTAELSSTS